MLNFKKGSFVYNEIEYTSGIDFNKPEYVEMVKGLIDSTLIFSIVDIPIYIQVSPNPNIAAAVSFFRGEYVLMICSNKLDMINDELDENGKFAFFNSLIVHEIKHLEQIKRGDLVISEETPDIITWKGKQIKVIEANTLEYVEQEWEVEAIEAELQYLVKMGIMSSMEEAYSFFKHGSNIVFTA